MPSSGLWEQAKPGWRSAADTQRAEAGRAEANVQREGTGSPELRERLKLKCAPYQAARLWSRLALRRRRWRRSSRRITPLEPKSIGT